ncbi:MAG: DUF5106 domain-containing protein [Macellibacteroides fermentans]|uniref:DUF5106 domain-containing protein n=1 Tax=Macellibacteroides fermentans TaxID=879969 RepID=UPI003AD066C2
MKKLRKIVKKYKWDFIGVWLSILTMSIGMLICIGVLTVKGCNCISEKLSEQMQAVVKTKPFTLPTIPDTLIDSALHAESFVKHYWDNLNFADTTFLSAPSMIEQAFVDYIVLFPYTTSEITASSIGESEVVRIGNAEYR